MYKPNKPNDMNWIIYQISWHPVRFASVAIAVMVVAIFVFVPEGLG